MVSRHWTEERAEREARIQAVGIGYEVDRFIVDRGHKNGAEIHAVTSNAIIIVYNLHTLKMVTKLFARPAQIIRYYEAEGRRAPQELLDIAREHQMKGYNV